MKFGIFLPNGSNGYIPSAGSPVYVPTFEHNKQIAIESERQGLDFILSMMKYKGFGGETGYWDNCLETFTLMAGLAAVTALLGLAIIVSDAPSSALIVLFFVLALALGAILTSPIGGADMPVVISLLNAFTGLAVGFEGYVLGNPALIVAGIVVGASGTLLTQLMAKAMNRPIRNIIFAPITGAAAEGGEAVGDGIGGGGHAKRGEGGIVWDGGGC